MTGVVAARKHGRITLACTVPRAALGLAVSLAYAVPGSAQVGPVETNGYVEYQYRQSRSDSMKAMGTHVGTFYTDVSSYVWRPWILQVNASLALSRISGESPNFGLGNTQKRDETVVTGRLSADLFRQSNFPFNAYVETQDSRVGSEVPGFDGTRRTVGFTQRITPPSNGIYLLEYRSTTTEREGNGFATMQDFVPLEHSADRWRATVDHGFSKHRFRYSAILSDFERSDTAETRTDKRHTLQHRFNGGNRLTLENTLFVSYESIDRQTDMLVREFRQFNSISTWRPDTSRPVVFTGRALFHDVESGQIGSTQDSQSAWVSGSVSYQPTDSITLGAIAGVQSQRADALERRTRKFNQLSAQVRSREYDVWAGRYRSFASVRLSHQSGSLGVGDGMGVDEWTQDINTQIGHTYSRQTPLSGGYMLDFNITQNLAGIETREGERGRVLGHTIFSTLSRRRGDTNTYLRVSATDRRSRGLDDRNMQLFNLQLSRSSRLDRRRSLSGSLTYQYVDHQVGRYRDTQTGSSSVNYSANVNYRHMDIFTVRDLDFISELRAQSSEFFSDDPFDEFDRQFDTERSDVDWRNRLVFEVGKLQMRLDANYRKVMDRWSLGVFFRIRRYYDL